MLTSATIIRQAYVRLGAWLGTSQEIDAQYNADADFEQIVTEAFPVQSMWDMLTAVEGEIATAVSKNLNNTLRSSIRDSALTTFSTQGAVIPTVGTSSATAKIIGEWGAVRDLDSETQQVLTQGLHLDEISAFIQAPTGLYKTTPHQYVLVPPLIFATVDNLIIEVCTFDQTVRAAAIAANAALLFQMAQNAYFNGLMTYLKNEDPNYGVLSAQHEGPYRAWLEAQAPVAETAT